MMGECWKMLLAAQYYDLSNAELVELAQARDRLAYDVLFRRYDARICTYLARIVGNDEIGRDLAQETFLKVWQALPRLQGEKKFEAWLYRIAGNAARDHLRHKQLIQWLPWEENSKWAEDKRMKAIEDQELLKFALAQVPIKYRQSVILRVVEGRSHREIAEILDIDEKSVSVYVKRGLEKLRFLLAKYNELTE
jgi:RNA polymerase sigma-70 factor (ECF subfamily)